MNSPDTFIHPTAIIDTPCEIGAGTKVWHFCHVMAGSRIGRNCVLGQNGFVASGVIIGDGVKIQNNVSVYAGVAIEDDVFIGPSVVFTNVKTPRAFIDRKAAVISTRVKKGASIGANATIVCGVTIGEYALIGAGAVVTDDVPSHACMIGNPAVQNGWVCTCGARCEVSSTCPECALKRNF